MSNRPRRHKPSIIQLLQINKTLLSDLASFKYLTHYGRKRIAVKEFYRLTDDKPKL